MQYLNLFSFFYQLLRNVGHHWITYNKSSVRCFKENIRKSDRYHPATESRYTTYNLSIITNLPRTCNLKTNRECIRKQRTCTVDSRDPLLKVYYGFVILDFRAQEPKATVTYCDRALSVVRPSSVRPLDNLHFRPLQNRLMDFDEIWYGRNTHSPLQVLLFIGQIRQGADPGWAKIGHGVPFFKKLLRTIRLQQQTECIAMIWKLEGRSVVIFGSIPKSNFWRVFWHLFLLSHFSLF